MPFICPICSSRDHRSLYNKQVLHPLIGLHAECFVTELNYEQCQGCGHICLYPLFDEDVYTEYYSKVGSPSSATFGQRRFLYEQRRDFVTRTLGKRSIGRIIEVGASKGDLLKLFSSENELIGIELSEDCIAEAKNLPIKYYPYALEDTPAKAPQLLRSANLVIVCHVLEHTHNPKVFFNHLTNLIAENGYIYIEVPSVEAIARCKNSIANTLYIGHIHFFSISTLNNLAHEAGLSPIALDVSTNHNFPALRIMYRKNSSIEDIATLFNLHSSEFDRESYLAHRSLIAAIDTIKDGKCLIWGVGQDCLDVLKFFEADTKDNYANRIVLTDISTRKQGKVLFGLKVLSTEEIDLNEIACIAISTRSQLLQNDIRNSIQKFAPHIKVIDLYTSSTEIE